MKFELAILTALAAGLAAPVFPTPRAQSLKLRIARLLGEYPSVQRGHVGFKFSLVDSGVVLAEQESGHFFTPASNTKLYTTALALARLGPSYHFKTEIRASGPWAPGQTSVPDLQLIGGGDPNLSGRVLPYQVDAKPGDPIAPLRDLAGQLAAAGVKEVTGDVTGIAGRYAGAPYPDGWTIDDSIYDYGAPVSALTFNDNAVTVTLTGTETGELAGIATEPANAPNFFLNQVLTVPGTEVHVQVSRVPGSDEVVLTGTIGEHSKPWQQDVAVTDPAQWAANELIDALRECGIAVRGQARSSFEPWSSSAQGNVIASRESAALADIVTVVNKVSQNLHAEMLLREVGFRAQGAGTFKAGLEERKKFLQELGITPETTGVALDDGSGLARQDLTTPESTVTLLRAMWKRPEKDIWVSSLPIGGVDGSLEHRFQGVAGGRRIHAKTGSLSHVNALSGYIETGGHRWLAFSVMVNATDGHQAEVRSFIDRLCALFLSIQ